MDRWRALFKGPLLIQRYRDREDLKPLERSTVSDIVNIWRSKLSSISWLEMDPSDWTANGFLVLFVVPSGNDRGAR